MKSMNKVVYPCSVLLLCLCCDVSLAQENKYFLKPIKPTGKLLPVGSLSERNHKFHFVTYSPDGKFVAAGTAYGDVIVWDAATGSKRYHYKAKDPGIMSFVNSLSFSPDGRYLSVTQHWESDIRLWHMLTGAPMTTHKLGLLNVVTEVVFHPKQNMYAVVYNAIVTVSIDGVEQNNTHQMSLYQYPSGKLVESHQFKEKEEVTKLTFSPDGRLAALGYTDGSFALWNVKEKKTISKVTGQHKSINDLQFSHNGQFLATVGGMDNQVKIWNLKSTDNIQRHKLPDSPIRVIKGLREIVGKVRWSKDDKYLALAQYEPGDRTDTFHDISIRNVKTGKEVVNFGSGEYVVDGKTKYYMGGIAMAFSPDGKMLATTHPDGLVRLWSLPKLLAGK